ncbi:VF530 family DNA-binding protein [Thalassotalea sp. LPB0316]|uniref:VF530 family protein n=1 Tax=Thalassotalea sp. LPB0316 TaxID=2769490 RepID=UPI00186759AC|nr:VF530 family DNA-binding protein [Thalassotalea sp. LPB0316]QOL24342.1 VF530 family DNA-binding protein [Thalassotalea sp. LPB0316]
MTDNKLYENNPLHGTSLSTVLNELVDHYGFAILYAYLNINCFNKNPSIAASLKFLKKTQWAREKVESFYLYQYKNLPRASASEFEKPPRERIIPDGVTPQAPAELSFTDAAILRKKRQEKAEHHKQANKRQKSRTATKAVRASTQSAKADTNTKLDPWADYR